VRLATDRAPAASGLEAAVGEVLDRRLLRDHRAPIAVALSGGGDSLALTLAAADWAARAGRRLLVLTVDHGLRPESVAWTRACADIAARLGLAFRPLAWRGDKPRTGLPAAARAARHALLAEAAREAGARVILMGHTGDDLLEARLMRAAGSTTPDAREWAPSPAWPQGRGVFLLRPMLGLGRAEIRDWLLARGETWIEDPANADLAYARPRARGALAQGARPAPPAPPASARTLAQACRPDAQGGFEIDRTTLRAAVPGARARFVSVAALSAAGTTRPPAGARVRSLAERLAGNEAFIATLAGARVAADAGAVRFRREPGEAARGGLAPLRLAAGETAVWDGRFEVSATAPVKVQAVRRTTLPAAVGEDGKPAVVAVRPLTHERLLAACGAVAREPA